MGRAEFAQLNLALIFAVAIVGMFLYRRSNPDVSGVRGSRLLSSTVRSWYFSLLKPFEDLMVRRRVRPIVLTYAQFGGSLLCAGAYASGLIFCAGVLLLASGTLDILDGRLARRLGWASKQGAFLDSVVDRYAESAVFIGVMLYFGSGAMMWVSLLALLGGMMVSYSRARAEGLGQSCDVGMLQRPERFVLLGFGSIFSSVAAHSFGTSQIGLILVVTLLAVLSNVTALQRIVYISGELDGVDPAEGDDG